MSFLPLILNNKFYLLLSFVIIIIAFSAFFVYKKHFIMYIVFLEIIFIASAINFVSTSYFLSEINGQIFVILSLIITGCETAVALAFILLLYKKKRLTTFSKLINIKGS